MTAVILFCSGAVTFGLIAWATPSVYTAMVNDGLQRQTDDLVSRLAETDFSDCGAVLDEFIRTSGADVMLLDEEGNAVDTGSGFSLQPVSGDENTAISSSASDEEKNSGESESGSLSAASSGSGEENDGEKEVSSSCPSGSGVKNGSVSATWVQTSEGEDSPGIITTLQQDAVFAEVSFADRGETYHLYVTPHTEEENLAVQAMIRMAPWLLLALLVFSLLCAVLYSRCITRPIVRLSAIAKKMAGLDFDLECGEQRPDEIGALGRSLDQMAGRLSSALKELENTNLALRREMEKEREMERRRTAFFSAASHELKTPVTILKGQLTGMLEGIDVYRDRDRYLLRSLQVTGRMENLIREMLVISRMETGTGEIRRETLLLSGLIEKQITLYGELAEQRGQQLILGLSQDITVTGDPSLLGKAVGNLLSNASLYSPEGAEIRVRCGKKQGHPVVTVENTGVHIREEALPRLFDAFYREESSRSRSTGGSGLGLYLVRMILKRHNASCTIENTADGVLATVLFP